MSSHGTTWRYDRYGCRCPDCRKAKQEANCHQKGIPPRVPVEEARPHLEALVSSYGGVKQAAQAYAGRYGEMHDTAWRRFMRIRGGENLTVNGETYDRIVTLHRSLVSQRIISFPVVSTYQAGWQEEALCARLSPEAADEMFFSDTRNSAPCAQAICAQCPVWEECIRYAAKETHSWQYGVVGGLAQHERRGLGVEEAIEIAQAKRQDAVA